MTDPVTNPGTERNLATFEEACRKSPAPDLIRLVLAVADVMQRLKERMSVALAHVRNDRARPVGP